MQRLKVGVLLGPGVLGIKGLVGGGDESPGLHPAVLRETSGTPDRT